jgi:xanthine dehydrogenase accessory factor
MTSLLQNIDIYEEIARLRREGRRAALATIIQIRGSVPSFETAKILVRDDGSTVGTVGGGCVENDVWKAARQVMFEEKPRRLLFDLTDSSNLEAGLICGGKVEIFIEPILATPTAYIFGGGHISKSISKMATLAGFNTVIIDVGLNTRIENAFPKQSRSTPAVSKRLLKRSSRMSFLI